MKTSIEQDIRSARSTRLGILIFLGIFTAALLISSLFNRANGQQPTSTNIRRDDLHYCFRLEARTGDAALYSVWKVAKEIPNGRYEEYLGGERLGTIRLEGYSGKLRTGFHKHLRWAYLNPGTTHKTEYHDVASVKTHLFGNGKNYPHRTWYHKQLYLTYDGEAVSAFYRLNKTTTFLWGVPVVALLVMLIALNNTPRAHNLPFREKLREASDDAGLLLLFLSGTIILLIFVPIAGFGLWRNLGWNLLLLLLSTMAGALLSIAYLGMVRGKELLGKRIGLQNKTL